MTAKKLFWRRSAAAIGVMVGAMVLALWAAQPAAAAELGQGAASMAVDEQTVPEPADPANPGDLPGEGAAPGAADGDSAVADGGSATPWVMLGIGVLLVLAIGAAMWSARTPRRMDLEGTVSDTGTQEHRFIPPGV
ncbi:MAG: hypothetical protein AB7F65_00755 [Dehalococcoidia bacterium]